jgi:hypothetical protein
MQEQSTLKPFLRSGLDILFIGLNPANGSSRNRHYFSVNSAFWNQLFDSGLITTKVDKLCADELVFGGNSINLNRWSYGITDLLPEVAESDSAAIHPTRVDCQRLADEIQRCQPRAAVLLHRKVVEAFLPFYDCPIPPLNSGQIGLIISGFPTMFFNIAFPHGNTIPSQAKVAQYRKIWDYLSKP